MTPTRPHQHRNSVAGFFIDLARFGGRRLLQDNAPEMAAALAYRTLFSLIPVLVISLIIFKGLLTEKDMKNALTQLMEYTGLDKIQVVDRPGAPEAPPAASVRITDTLQEFIDKTVARIQGINFGVITVVGVLVLLYGALSLVIQVEQAFNQICRAPTGRRLRARLTSYFTLLVLGPILLVGGVGVGRTPQTTLTEFSPWIGRPLSLISTFGITWVLLLMAYSWMPNARIRLNAAAIGAFLAAILWEGAKAALAWFVAYLVDPATGGQTAVYGSLALLPIFLMWVYITWLIVLFGFEVTYAVQTVASGRHRFLDRPGETPIIDPAVGVVLMKVLAERFTQGKPCTVEELARRAAVSESVVERVLAHLVAKEFVHKVEQREDADITAYSPARAPDSLTAADILAAMHDLAGEPPSDGQAGLADLSVLRLLRKSQLEALRTLKLTGLNEAPPPH
jgi:membrane protein